MFIVSVVQYVKIGDLSSHQTAVHISSDAPAEGIMDVDASNESRLPDGTDIGGAPVLSREEERALTRESTVAFAGALETCCNTIYEAYIYLTFRLGHIAFQARVCSI